MICPLFSDQLNRNYRLNDYHLEVDIADLRNYDEELTDKLVKQPSEYLPLVGQTFHIGT